MVHKCLTNIQLPDFMSGNQLVTWITDKNYVTSIKRNILYFYVWTFVKPFPERDSIHRALGLDDLLNEKVDDLDHQATTAGHELVLISLVHL